MKLKCIKNIDGFTINKEYKVLGCAGEYVELIDDNNEKYIINEGYFDIVTERGSEKVMNIGKIKKIIGYALGSTCFLPTFLAVCLIAKTDFLRAIILLVITQSMWLISIYICTSDLEIENRTLKNKVKELEDKR